VASSESSGVFAAARALEGLLLIESSTPEQGFTSMRPLWRTEQGCATIEASSTVTQSVTPRCDPGNRAWSGEPLSMRVLAVSRLSLRFRQKWVLCSPTQPPKSPADLVFTGLFCLPWSDTGNCKPTLKGLGALPLAELPESFRD
jgi:hypothetical protein